MTARALLGSRTFFIPNILANYSADDSGTGAVTASIVFQSNGSVTGDINSSWGAPILAGAGTNYECKMSFVSGDSFTSGTLNVWLSLNSNHAWSRDNPNAGTVKSTQGLIEFRNATTLAAIGSASIFLDAERTDSGGGS